jgi:hypothetical protein
MPSYNNLLVTAIRLEAKYGLLGVTMFYNLQNINVTKFAHFQLLFIIQNPT